MAIDEPINIKPSRPAIQHPNRRQRIERWARKGLCPSNQLVKVLRSPHVASPSLTQKRAENRLLQYDRCLNTDLIQLSAQREKLIDQQNFNQNLFARKQLLLHKNDDNLLKTLNYVQKCCKLANLYDHDDISIDPATLLEEHETMNKPTRTRSLVSSASTTKRIETKSSETKYLPTAQRGVQSAFITNSSQQIQNDRPWYRSIQTAHESRTYPSSSIESVTSTVRVSNRKTFLNRSRTSKIRTFPTRLDIEEFRHYPERFLSKTNCYLPLLNYYAKRMRSDEEDQTEENIDLVKHKRPYSSSCSSNTSYSMLDEPVVQLSDNHELSKEVYVVEKNIRKRSDRAKVLSCLRDREYRYLQTLIGKSPIEQILKPLSPMKTFETKH